MSSSNTPKPAVGPSSPVPDLAVAWCTDVSLAGTLAEFFVSNVDPEYVSHGELQVGRALHPGEWAGELPELLRQELEGALDRSRSVRSVEVAIGRQAGRLVALAIVNSGAARRNRYVVLEDLVIERQHRSEGIGAAMLEWIEARALERGARRIFLESGVENRGGLRFFESHGFVRCSVTLLKDLQGR